ncbi:MAG: type II toxin-antitoxin system PemK/MazF family toxin [Crocinitomicaceae bacterium]|jgi:mRNA interferase MazF|nr:type II toxin-antitoxin system PemK/MazF family toxin [Crocinitomicaceae bacterium]MDP5011458.1 type II toxin-antitoxin system PemK/MazF family toxin [Crocinitomicaceae bacterium]
MKQGEIWLTDLNPVKGSEQSGTRPVVILSGNLLNTHLPLVICCPLTSKIKNYKGNIVLKPNSDNKLTQDSEVLLFHIRSLSKDRLLRKIGCINKSDLELLKKSLNEILTY